MDPSQQQAAFNQQVALNATAQRGAGGAEAPWLLDMLSGVAANGGVAGFRGWGGMLAGANPVRSMFPTGVLNNVFNWGYNRRQWIKTVLQELGIPGDVVQQFFFGYEPSPAEYNPGVYTPVNDLGDDLTFGRGGGSGWSLG